MNHETNWSDGDAGGLCWISDPSQAYVEATFKSMSGQVATIETQDGITYEVDVIAPTLPPSRKQKEIPRRLLQRVAMTANNGVGNMDELPVLHEASILQNIELRFRMDRIYTNSGPILIAMNPFKWLPIYGEEVIKSYHNRPYGSMEPHVFQEAEDSLQTLMRSRGNQAIVICGESGAGKTETTKLMLQYLSVISKKMEGGDGSEGLSMGEKIVQSNPLMEAFGNAKTLRNNNSSRFGKFTALHYTSKYTISGCEITNLLLEKSRVTFQPHGERNYHIFYQIQSKVASKYMLAGEPNSMHFTNQSQCTEVDGMDDDEEYNETVLSMQAVDVEEAEIDNVMKVVAAILNLGNVSFAGAEPCSVDGAAQSYLNSCCELMGVPAAKMAQALVTRVRELPGGEMVTSNNNIKESEDLRDAVAKSVYSSLFDYIVIRINKTLDKTHGADPKFIGVLDIFGFEDMTINGFEQLFINTTNEMLQKVFNDIIFKKEAEEYQRENIAWDKTSFPDNEPCIELLTKKPVGLLKMLDSECTRGKAASDGNALVRKFNKCHAQNDFYAICGPSTVWRRKDNSRTRDEDFLIHHFAGPIIYTVSDFVGKNRDALFAHVYDVLSESKNPLIASLYEPRESTDSASKQTVGNRFLRQLNELVKLLKESESRFVRCIKTNNVYKPAVVDKMSVLRQLVCSGVMAALEVRRAGFPSRKVYKEFVKEFRVFTPKTRCQDDRELCEKMLKNPHVAERVTEDQYRLGDSKLFMQAEVLYTLQSVKNRIIYPFVRRIQIWWLKAQGDILERKIRRAENAVGTMLQTATSNGVQQVVFVRKAFNALREQQALCRQNPKDRAGIAALGQLTEKAENAVQQAINQKEEAYRIRAEILSVLDSYANRLNTVKLAGKGLFDQRAVALLMQEAEEAEEMLNECREEQMLAANSWDQAILNESAKSATGGLRRAATSANLLAGASKANLAQTAEDLKKQREENMEDVKDKVAGLEELCDRFCSDNQKMVEARAEYSQAIVDANDRLDAIPVEQFIIAGITVVSDAVASSREKIYNAQRLLESLDAEAFKSAVVDARQSVEAALHVAAFEQARVSAMAELDDNESFLEEIERKAKEDQIHTAAGFQPATKEAHRCIEDARASAMDEDVGVLETKTTTAVNSVDCVKDVYERNLEIKKEAHRAKFNNIRNKFNAKPAATTQRLDGGKSKAGKSGPSYSSRVGRRERPAREALFKAPEPVSVPAYTPPPRAAPAPIPARVEKKAPRAAPAPVAAPPAPAPAAAAPAGDMDIEDWIDACKMTKYKVYLLSMAGELEDLKGMEDDDVEDIVSSCSIPKLAARRFRKALIELGANVTAK